MDDTTFTNGKKILAEVETKALAKVTSGDFPGGPAAKNPLSNAGDTGLGSWDPTRCRASKPTYHTWGVCVPSETPRAATDPDTAKYRHKKNISV